MNISLNMVADLLIWTALLVCCRCDYIQYDVNHALTRKRDTHYNHQYEEQLHHSFDQHEHELIAHDHGHFPTYLHKVPPHRIDIFDHDHFHPPYHHSPDFIKHEPYHKPYNHYDDHHYGIPGGDGVYHGNVHIPNIHHRLEHWDTHGRHPSIYEHSSFYDYHHSPHKSFSDLHGHQEYVGKGLVGSFADPRGYKTGYNDFLPGLMPGKNKNQDGNQANTKLDIPVKKFEVASDNPIKPREETEQSESEASGTDDDNLSNQGGNDCENGENDNTCSNTDAAPTDDGPPTANTDDSESTTISEQEGTDGTSIAQSKKLRPTLPPLAVRNGNKSRSV